MNEALRLEIVQPASARNGRAGRLPRELGISRGTVKRVLARLREQRDGAASAGPGPRRRASLIDAYEPIRENCSSAIRTSRWSVPCRNCTPAAIPAGTPSPPTACVCCVACRAPPPCAL